MLILLPYSFGTLIILGLVAGFLWRGVARFFLRFIAPRYAKAISRGNKFLIRFADHELPELETRREKWNKGIELANGSLLLLVFLISVLSAQYVDMAATGKGMVNYECESGDVVLFEYVNDGYADCSDGSDEDVVDPVSCPGDVCVLGSFDRFSEAFMQPEVFMVLMFAPMLTCIVAPLAAIKNSSLAVVEKDSKSISPIGGKLLDMTNAATGFGALVIGGKTLWTMATAASAGIGEAIGMVTMGILLFLSMFWFFYHTIWISAVIYSSNHNTYVRRFDELITKSANVEIHQVRYDGNTIVIEAPSDTPSTNTAVPSIPSQITSTPYAAPVPAMSTTQPLQQTSVPSWEQLLPGGRYDYSEGTKYIAPDGSIWIQNINLGFDKIG